MNEDDRAAFDKWWKGLENEDETPTWIKATALVAYQEGMARGASKERPKTGRSDIWWSRLREYLATTRSIAEVRNNTITEHVVIRDVLRAMDNIEEGRL